MTSFGAQESKSFGQMEGKGRAQSPAGAPGGSPFDEETTQPVPTVQRAPEPPQGRVENGMAKLRALMGPALERHSQGEPMVWEVGYFMMPDPHLPQMHMVLALYTEIPSPIPSPEGKPQVLTRTGEFGVFTGWDEAKADATARDIWEGLRATRSELLGQAVPQRGLIVP